jgi:drug/metabolite transporter (DMT)-like permease
VLLFLALLGVALNQVFFVLGMARTSVAHAAVIIAMTPVWVLLLAAAMKIEKLGTGRLLGMAVAFGGVLVLQLGPSRGGNATVSGDLLIFGGSAVFAVFTIVGKRVSNALDTVTLNTFAYVLGGAVLLPIAWWDLSHAGLARISATGWTSVIYMAAVPSVLCYLIYYYALRWMAASRLSAFSYIQPLIATTFAIPVLGEQPTPALLGGGVLVLAGVMMTERL